VFERPAADRPGIAESLREMRFYHFANGLAAWLLAATGPVALVLGIGLEGGMSARELGSYIFIGFFVGGLMTIVLSVIYRSPMIHAWTIPGSAIAGLALLKGIPYTDIVGAYLVVGAIMLVLGITGGFGWLMRHTPVPLVMAMIAGVFLKFGLWVVLAFESTTWIALAATAAFIGITLRPGVARNFPPILGALVAATVVAVATGQFQLKEPITRIIVEPVFFVPTFSTTALLDLVLPLLISVLALQNAQGIVILRQGGHNPPPNTITFACGAGSIAYGLFGCVNACLTAPASALVMSSGNPRHQWIGACWWAVLAMTYGVFAPVVTALALAVPKTMLFVIGGLAMMRVLQQSFVQGFGSKFTMGATVTFVVTVTDLIPGYNASLLGIGAPFWGLVFGMAVSLLLERGDFVTEENDRT
jgi:benzoate membrane transport protein